MKTAKKNPNNAFKIAAYGQRDMKIDLTSEKGKFRSLNGLLDTLHVSFELNFGLGVKKVGNEIGIYFSVTRAPDKFTRKKALSILKKKMKEGDAIAFYCVRQFFTKEELLDKTSNQIVKNIFEIIKKNIIKNVKKDTWGFDYTRNDMLHYKLNKEHIIMAATMDLVGK